ARRVAAPQILHEDLAIARDQSAVLSPDARRRGVQLADPLRTNQEKIHLDLDWHSLVLALGNNQVELHADNGQRVMAKVRDRVSYPDRAPSSSRFGLDAAFFARRTTCTGGISPLFQPAGADLARLAS